MTLYRTVILYEKYFSDDQFSYIVYVSGGHKQCALQQVLNTQVWSELWRCVQIHGGHGEALSTTRVRDGSASGSRVLLSRPLSLGFGWVRGRVT